jgi:hypothetical protein
MSLEREIETYHKLIPDLLQYEGKFVVIRGEELLGCYADWNEALNHGYEQYGEDAFLVRQISKTEKVLFSSRSLRPCPTLRET